MDGLRTVEQAAERILEDAPDPVVRFRILRDVLRRPHNDRELGEAAKAMVASRWVNQLASEQHSDGSWGRFHTKDYSARQRIPTTEFAVDRALALGLTREHRMVAQAVDYLVAILQARARFPDRAEKTELWPWAVRLFTGAKLAALCPDYPLVRELWRFWSQVAHAAFVSGSHDPEAEATVFERLTGLPLDRGYLELSTKYHVSILGAKAAAIPQEIECALVSWFFHDRKTIGYLDAKLDRLPTGLTRFGTDAWFTSLALLSRFPSWRAHAADALTWLWQQQTEEGYWDFGPRSTWSPYFPLSESWRRKHARQHDWSTRVLLLLHEYHRRA